MSTPDNLMPGTLPQLYRWVMPRISTLLSRRFFPALAYAPLGWDTPLDHARSAGWDDPRVLATELANWNAYVESVRGGAAVGLSHEDDTRAHSLLHHNVAMSFAYAIAEAAQARRSLSVLDWGGGLGHYGVLSRALFPGIEFDYHVRERAPLAHAGATLDSGMTFHDDDSCLDSSFDVVLVNASLQYMRDWKAVLPRLARCATRSLVLMRIPVVQTVPTYVAVQAAYGVQMLHQQLNERELLGVLADNGSIVFRELLIGGAPYIRGAPEQPDVKGWIFHRATR